MEPRSSSVWTGLGLVLRLAVLSIVVGVALSAVGVTPRNLFYHLNIWAHRIYSLGFGAIDWLLQYLILGAIIVVPVWLIARLLGLGQSGGPRGRI